MILPPQVFPPNASIDDRLKGVRKLISQLKQDSKRPILLGPWRSELGFEALYWMPFLHWLKTQVPNFDTRACVVTRGGIAPLYQAMASQGYDLYALRSVEDVRRENLADAVRTGMQKQVSITDWDTSVLEDAAKALGIGPVYDVVHPGWMYWALSPYWEEHVAGEYLSQHTVYDALPMLPKPDGLPAQYVVAKFYGRPTFPYPERDVSQFIQRVCGLLAAQIPVVVLTSQEGYDDHVDATISGPNIIQMPGAAPAENVLQLAAVMQHAKAVVGTYGGAMQLALRLGVPSVSFYKSFNWTARAHLTLSQWVGTKRNVPFLTGSMSDVGLWSQVLTPPVVQVQPMAVQQQVSA